jgi:glycerophosphoryl diester phosphodiesterase
VNEPVNEVVSEPVTAASDLPPWPYPRWIAHRGAGKLAPENTLAAFRVGASHGYTMFECDVKLTHDRIPFLLHDDDLDRTTDGIGDAGSKSWEGLTQLDAGSWHSPAFAGEPMPCFENIARYCIFNGFHLNIEIKPSPGAEARTGYLVAEMAAWLWRHEPMLPLLTSFKPEALKYAREAAPKLPRGLLLGTLRDDWLAEAQALGCVAIICQHKLWTAATVAMAKAAGFRTLSYTVNDADEVQRLLDLGTDGIITDRVDLFSPGK